jgi:hypothetical protein
MVPRHREHGRPERAEEISRPLVLRAPVPMGEVAARDHELGGQRLDELSERHLDLRLLVLAHVQVRHLQEA